MSGLAAREAFHLHGFQVGSGNRQEWGGEASCVMVLSVSFTRSVFQLPGLVSLGLDPWLLGGLFLAHFENEVKPSLSEGVGFHEGDCLFHGIGEITKYQVHRLEG